VKGESIKLALTLNLFFIVSLAQAYELEETPRQVGVGNNKAANYTRDALLSYDAVVERSDYLIYKFKQLTFGEYADQLMILAPLISGRVEFQAYKDVNFYYNSFSQSGGFRYSINF
tara:strand:+ start:13969 stop:14316 length:348 start_codon:yes stop_codon:yes gene_type:complete